MPFLKYLLVIVCIYYIIKTILRFILRSFIGNVEQQSRRQYEQQKKTYRKEAEKPVGKVSVDYIPEEKKTFSSSEGDYVDFEEVK